MGLKTRAILIANVTTPTMDKSRKAAMKANEDVLNEAMIVRSCFNCTEAQWNKDFTEVKCTKFNAAPPAWCIACGCDAFDYIPF